MQIEKIIQMSKDLILKNGSHMPAMHIEFKNGKSTLALMPTAFNTKTNFEKVQNFYTAGSMIGKEYPGESIAALAFVAEAWGSVPSPDNPNFEVMPSKDPKRVEVLIITSITLSEEKAKLHVVELIRDGQGKLMDILPWSDYDEDTVVDTYMLASFAAGFESTKMTEEEKRDIVAKVARERGLDLSGEEVASVVSSLEAKDVHKFHFSPDGKLKARGSVLRKNKKKRRHARGW
jgi:hypothetical protein